MSMCDGDPISETTISSPGFQLRDSARDTANMFEVALAPKAISLGAQASRSPSAALADSMRASVSSLLGNLPWVLATPRRM